ncbi:MAG: MarR family winged helix-turn-helix transcriptional regulator [Gemmatimonadaceae bacterium]
MQAADVLGGVRRLERGLRLAARAAERSTGLTAAQLFVLEQLALAESSSIADLAARTHTDRSSVSVVIDRLAAAGLVKCSPSSDDRRRTETEITKRGRAVLGRAPLSPTTGLVRAVSRLPATKVRQLAATLAALNEQLGYTEEAMLFDEEKK